MLWERFFYFILFFYSVLAASVDGQCIYFLKRKEQEAIRQRDAEAAAAPASQEDTAIGGLCRNWAAENKQQLVVALLKSLFDRHQKQNRSAAMNVSTGRLLCASSEEANETDEIIKIIYVQNTTFCFPDEVLMNLVQHYFRNLNFLYTEPVSTFQWAEYLAQVHGGSTIWQCENSLLSLSTQQARRNLTWLNHHQH